MAISFVFTLPSPSMNSHHPRTFPPPYAIAGGKGAGGLDERLGAGLGRPITSTQGHSIELESSSE